MVRNQRRLSFTRTIPAELSALKALVELDLSNNQISTIPESISDMPALKVVY
jgi:Leucine-rich repeat (LRR) protein